MTPEDIASRLLNGGVVVTMVCAGIAYGLLLWSYDIRANTRLFAVAVFPGAIFLSVVWSVRAFQGVAAATYLALLVDWTIFSIAGYLTVQTWRRIVRRRKRRS